MAHLCVPWHTHLETRASKLPFTARWFTPQRGPSAAGGKFCVPLLKLSIKRGREVAGKEREGRRHPRSEVQQRRRLPPPVLEVQTHLSNAMAKS